MLWLRCVESLISYRQNAESHQQAEPSQGIAAAEAIASKSSTVAKQEDARQKETGDDEQRSVVRRSRSGITGPGSAGPMLAGQLLGAGLWLGGAPGRASVAAMALKEGLLEGLWRVLLPSTGH